MNPLTLIGLLSQNAGSAELAKAAEYTARTYLDKLRCETEMFSAVNPEDFTRWSFKHAHHLQRHWLAVIHLVTLMRVNYDSTEEPIGGEPTPDEQSRFDSSHLRNRDREPRRGTGSGG